MSKKKIDVYDERDFVRVAQLTWLMLALAKGLQRLARSFKQYRRREAL